MSILPSKLRPLAALAVVVLVSACKPESHIEKKPEAARAAPRSVTRVRSDVPLADRLAHEAENRPERALRADAVFSALRAAGVPLVRTRQVLGETLGASYCETSLTDKGTALAVCEFSDDASAERGRDLSRALFDKLIRNRVLAVNGQTLLTVVSPAPTAPEAQRVLARFASL